MDSNYIDSVKTKKFWYLSEGKVDA